MPRCTRTWSLEVHHILRTGTNNLSNAVVLCHPCHVMTDSYGTDGPSPPDFSEETKVQAIQRAGDRFLEHEVSQ